VFTPDGSPFTGQHVLKANEAIIADLKGRGLLFLHEPLQHTYPHCWRCKNPIIFRATEQWFLNVDHNGLRARLKETIEENVQFVPPAGRERILGMVNTRPDWCLSRQRLWGVPIPAVVCLGCNEKQYLFVEVIEHVAELVKTQGTDIWFEKPIEDLVPKGFKCPHCHQSKFEKTNDILDVWFDSGVSHQAVFRGMLDRPLPADLYLEGSDQHRGWFQSSIIPSVALDGGAPYKGVLTHGFVVDGQGRKMSKSLGNVIKPQELIDQNGAEIVRLWVMSSSYNDDVRISKEILERLVDGYRKIRNTVRYLLGNLSGFDPQKDSLAYADILPLDRFALHRLAMTIAAVGEAYDAYDFPKAYKTLHAYCNEELSSIYLDILKDRLYTCPAQMMPRKSAQTVLYHILDGLTRMLAPVMAFTAEEMLCLSPKTKETSQAASVHLLDWPQAGPEWFSGQIEAEFQSLLALRDQVLKALDEQRKSGAIGSGLQAKVILKTGNAVQYAAIEGKRDLLEAVFIVSQVELLNQGGQGWDIKVVAADGTKCGRCWNYRIDVGNSPDHPTLCGRCVQQLSHI
jgi:isoleucyl-tRNA synthetase